jgi:hypothetical protein
MVGQEYLPQSRSPVQTAEHIMENALFTIVLRGVVVPHVEKVLLVFGGNIKAVQLPA